MSPARVHCRFHKGSEGVAWILAGSRTEPASAETMLPGWWIRELELVDGTEFELWLVPGGDWPDPGMRPLGRHIASRLLRYATEPEVREVAPATVKVRLPHGPTVRASLGPGGAYVMALPPRLGDPRWWRERERE